MNWSTRFASLPLCLKFSIFHSVNFLLTQFRWEGEGAANRPLLASFSSVTSANVEISAENFLSLSLSNFDILV